MAKRGKTPSRYRHMMCFGADGHSHSHAGLTGTGDVPSSVDGRTKHESAGRNVPRVSFKEDTVACSLFTVAV